MDTNTTLITSKSKYDDVGIIEVSQASSSSACFTTDLTFSANPLATAAANVDASCFIIHSGVEVMAENESLVGHGDGGKMIQSAKDKVDIAKDPGLWLDISADDEAYWTACGLSDCQHHNGYLTSLTGISVVANQQDSVRRNFVLGQKPMVRNTRESDYCIHNQQDQLIILFVNCLLLKISHILLQENSSVTGEMQL